MSEFMKFQVSIIILLMMLNIRGVAKLVKAPDFDSGMRRFESFRPCHFLPHISSNSPVGVN